ncbi:MAG TPA: hypothetical protein VKA36_00105 [Solirubrobacterales bacterium]|nr:hypothetical protein [Solirubrobacterales bacterium]
MAAWLICLLAAGQAHAAIGTPQRVADIRSGPGNSDPGSFEQLGRFIYFEAFTDDAGNEVWRSDGSANGTQRISQIRPGSQSGLPGSLTRAGGLVFFSASDGAGDELWRTNGTAAGTFRVRDIRPGATGSNPRGLARLGSQVIFRADNGTHGKELFRSNGTNAGTQLIRDLNPGAGNGAGNFAFPTTIGNHVYFRGTEPTVGSELFRTDGTDAGTELVGNVALAGSSEPSQVTAVGNQIFFTADGNDGTGRELWVTSGEPGSASFVRDIDGAATDSGVTGLTAFKGSLFFSAEHPTYGNELLRSGGTLGSTVIAGNIAPGGADGDPAHLTPLGDWLYFEARGAGGDRELWRSDGFTGFAVFQQVADINPGGSSLCLSPELTPFDGEIYFCASDGSTGNELYRTTGGGTGAERVADINPSGSSNPSEFTVVGDTLYFRADDDSSGTELWAIDSGAPDTNVLSAPDPGEHIKDRTPAIKLGSGALDLSRFQCSTGAGFSNCAGRDGSGSAPKMKDGPQTLRMRAVDVRNNPDPTPEQVSFVVDKTAPKLRIKGRRLRVNRRGVARARLKCPASELTGPCKGKLVLKTRKRVELAKKKKKLKLARKKFSLEPGTKTRVKLKIGKRKLRALRGSKKARKVKAKAKVRDGLRNKRTVKKKQKLKLRR